jgi:hypothetical protein
MRTFLYGTFLFLQLGWIRAQSQDDGKTLQIVTQKEIPFVVLVGEKSYVSTPVGQALIPGLKDSVYNIVIKIEGIPTQLIPFTIPGNQAILAFELRSQEDKGWVLYNLQTGKELLPSNYASQSASVEKGEKKEDAFAQLMAAVVNDTAVLYNSYNSSFDTDDSAARGQPVTRREDQTRKKLSPDKLNEPDTAAKLQAGAESPGSAGAPPHPAKTGITSKTNVTKGAGVKRINVHKSATELWMKYVVTGAGGKDTVTLSIPFEQTVQDTVVSNAAKKGATTQKGKPAVASATHGRDSMISQGNLDTPVKTTQVRNCVKIAKDYEVDVLRVQILTENSLEDKIAAAEKMFKTTCFSTRQIRALSELFSNDRGRFRFYETAYPNVTDRDQFVQLAETLTSPDYLGQFKFLVGQ